MSTENYVDGDLGPVFSNAEPLTLPVVVQLLRDRRDAVFDEPGSGLLEHTLKQVELMQETCADEMNVQRVGEMRLRLRVDGNYGCTNAHLGNFSFDRDGNITGVPEGDLNNDVDGDFSASEAQRMKAFEVVALATLRPKTVDEAVVLVPSLARFEPSELGSALGTLDSF
uniref:Uncharacterized protein n=1 Tax=Trypanosoma congolense (strain IL3000) TaxID=1068625 RepID=G0UKI2_TRYCI|nr:conserved hypothetical protein [Trypanosoma congolense IL3000]